MEMELELVLELVFRRSPLLLTLVPPACANESPLWRPTRAMLPTASLFVCAELLLEIGIFSPPFPEANDNNVHIIMIIYTGAKVSIPYTFLASVSPG